MTHQPPIIATHRLPAGLSAHVDTPSGHDIIAPA